MSTVTEIERLFEQEFESQHFIKVFAYCTPRVGIETKSFTKDEEAQIWPSGQAQPAAQAKRSVDAGHTPALFDGYGARNYETVSGKWSVSEVLVATPSALTCVLTEQGTGFKLTGKRIATGDSVKEGLCGKIWQMIDPAPNGRAFQKYMGFLTVDDDLFLTRPYQANPSIGEELRNGKTFSWHQVLQLISEISQVLSDSGACHGAIHVDNAFIGLEGTLRLTDHKSFLIKKFVFDHNGQDGVFRHPYYNIPEVELSWRYDVKCLGIMAIEMLEGDLGNIKESLGKGFPNYSRKNDQPVPIEMVKTIVQLINCRVDSFAHVGETLKGLNR